MGYRVRKVLFFIFSIIFGIMMIPAIGSTAENDGPIAFPIVVGCIFVLFVVLSIYNRNMDQHYWPPKKTKRIKPNGSDILVWDVYRIIRDQFPELPLKKPFLYSKEILDKLHLQCRKANPSQAAIQSVANEMWRHMGLETEVPTIYLVKREDSTAGFNSNSIAGLASTDYNERSLLVTFNKGFSADSIIGLLAHELCHFYQFDTNRVFSGLYGEIITDALTAYFGFADSYLTGRHYSYSKHTSLNTVVTYRGRLGYIKDDDLKKILFCLKNNASPIYDVQLNIKMIKDLFCILKVSYGVKSKMAEAYSNMPPILENRQDAAKQYKEFLKTIDLEKLEEDVNDLENNYSEEKLDALVSVFVADDVLYKCLFTE